MPSVKPAILAFALATTFAAPAAAQANGDALYGVWRNPKDSVHVEIRPCGENVCGYVLWASPKAQADARAGGTERLVGLQLFRDFKPQKDGVWKGKVFVPDLNRTFTGTAQPVGPNTLRARGCLLANVVCKAQTWTRIAPSRA